VPRTSTGSSSRTDRRARPDARRSVLEELRSLGLRPDRRLGQSFLVDSFVADAEAALVATAPGEPVLEVGGGLGILTEALLRRGLGPLTVIEKDPRLAAHLRERLGERATIVTGDALAQPIPAVRAAIGNLPYAAASPILRRLMGSGVPRIVAMVQREVAQRLAAAPGGRSYGRATIVAAALGTIELFRSVPPEAFVPEPAVESRIVRFEAHPVPVLDAPLSALEAVLDPLFASRRKQLKNLLPRLGPRTEALLRLAGWPDDWPGRRPEELPPEAYFRLAEARARRATSRPLRDRPAPAPP
jgi:16S rRNA (adenine1518-N6/adenine1519-N6)-dimethyltransferase